VAFDECMFGGSSNQHGNSVHTNPLVQVYAPNPVITFRLSRLLGVMSSVGFFRMAA
jgi:hypothetical protein